MHHNEVDGLIAHDRAVVDLHGTKTDIHSNKRGGIHADDRAKVNIHLLCLPNTMHPMTMLEEIEIIPTVWWNHRQHQRRRYIHTRSCTGRRRRQQLNKQH